MRGMATIVFILLTIGCVVGAFFAYKTLRLKAEVKMWRGYHDDAVARLESLKIDFAQVSVYRTDNERLLNETTLEQRKTMTVLFGASITKRWDTDGYFPNQGIINRGVGSQSDTQLLARFSSDVLQLDPGRVVLKICSGNFNPQADPEVIWDEFETMAITAESRGIRPLLATVIPATREAEEFEGYSMASEISKFNDRIRNFAADRGFAVVDYYQALADSDGCLPGDVARDTIHPNNKGYEVMASVLGPILER